MTFPETLGLLSGVFLIAGYVPYGIDVLRRKTIPSRASWLIWSLSTLLILFGVHATGTHEAIWVPIADAVGCSLIFCLSIFFGVGGWSKTDQLSFLICAASVLILFVTDTILITLLMNLGIYVSGYISTIKKAITDPKSESLFAWSLFFVGVLVNLLTVAIGTDAGLVVWLYPVVLVATVGTLYFFLLRPYIKALS